MLGQTNRRPFIAGLGGAAAWPLAASGQRAAIPVVGLFGTIPLAASIYVPDFKGGVTDLGFVEGTTVLYDWRTQKVIRNGCLKLQKLLFKHGRL